MLSELQKNLDNNTKSESKQRILFCSLFVFYSRNYGKEPLLLIRLLCSQKHKKGTEMQDNYTTKGKHLTIDSRRLIERWKKEGKSNREIASLLGTIHTEIKLNQGTKGKDSPLS